MTNIEYFFNIDSEKRYIEIKLAMKIAWNALGSLVTEEIKYEWL